MFKGIKKFRASEVATANRSVKLNRKKVDGEKEIKPKMFKV